MAPMAFYTILLVPTWYQQNHPRILLRQKPFVLQTLCLAHYRVNLLSCWAPWFIFDSISKRKRHSYFFRLFLFSAFGVTELLYFVALTRSLCSRPYVHGSVWTIKYVNRCFIITQSRVSGRSAGWCTETLGAYDLGERDLQGKLVVSIIEFEIFVVLILVEHSGGMSAVKVIKS